MDKKRTKKRNILPGYVKVTFTNRKLYKERELYIFGVVMRKIRLRNYTGPVGDNRVLKEAVLQKWRKIVDILSGENIPVNYESDSCAFCKAYLHKSERGSCDCCPIFNSTGEQDCKGTPFYDFQDAMDNRNYGLALDYAKKMLVFIEKLKV